MRCAVSPAVLLATTYCGPVPWFAVLAHFDRVYLEHHESYHKQTYRNRCVILGSNGPLTLVIPVEQGRKPGLPLRDVRIAWYERWQTNHWRAITSAYRNSPFFDHYAGEIHPFFEKRWTFLFDYNLELMATLIELTGLDRQVLPTAAFEELPESFLNLREVLSPKVQASAVLPEYREVPYTQVFEDKFSFVPGLSVLDLLFNAGPGAEEILRRSWT